MGGIQADHDLDNVFAFIAELDLKIDPREAAAKATVPPGRWWVWELGGSGWGLESSRCVHSPAHWPPYSHALM